MRYLIVFLLLNSSIVFSQKTKYTGGIIQVEHKNYGNNVTVEYDSFFDSYLISYTNVNGLRINERYDGSRILIMDPKPTFVCMSIKGTGKFISRLKKQK